MISRDSTAYQALEIEQTAQPIYLACSVEELILVEMDAWNQGYGRAVADNAPMQRLRELATVERAAEEACDVALLSYVPMDLLRFRDVFVRAWCGGYCTRLHERGTQQQKSQPRREDSQSH